MSFIWPEILWLLVLLPLPVTLYVRMQRRRRQLAASYGSMGFVEERKGRSPGFSRHIPPLLFLAGLAILVIAMARPQAVVALPKEEGTVILTFDVSGSMAATDIAPTRMDAAKLAAKAFVQRQPSSVQIGVVAFSDSGLIVQAPTSDQQSVLDAINRLSPQRGTSVGQGILTSLNAISAGSGQNAAGGAANLSATPMPTPTPVPKGSYTSAVIVMLTDGENNESPDPLAAAQTAAERGVRIDTVGIGSAAGTDLHINGFTVHTQLDEAVLQQISQITGGVYYNAQNESDLVKIYSNLDPQLVVKPEKTEVTSLFAGASVLVLLIGGVFSLLWFSRLP